jgi:hypothetical protein
MILFAHLENGEGFPGCGLDWYILEDRLSTMRTETLDSMVLCADEVLLMHDTLEWEQALLFIGGEVTLCFAHLQIFKEVTHFRVCPLETIDDSFIHDDVIATRTAGQAKPLSCSIASDLDFLRFPVVNACYFQAIQWHPFHAPLSHTGCQDYDMARFPGQRIAVLECFLVLPLPSR